MQRERERKRRFGVNAIISLNVSLTSTSTFRWRRNVSFSLSASLSLFSALTLSSHAHLWSLKLSLKMRVSSSELSSTLKNMHPKAAAAIFFYIASQACLNLVCTFKTISGCFTLLHFCAKNSNLVTLEWLIIFNLHLHKKLQMYDKLTR